MQLLWTISILTTFLSVGLLAVITSQNSAFHTLNGQIEDQLLKLDRLQVQLISVETVKISLEKQVVKVTEAAEELQAAVASLGSELERRKRENDACRAQKVPTFPPFICFQDHGELHFVRKVGQ